MKSIIQEAPRNFIPTISDVESVVSNLKQNLSLNDSFFFFF